MLLKFDVTKVLSQVKLLN